MSSHASSPDAHGHGDHEHHVFDKTILIRTFVGLIALTILTVVMAELERSGALPLGILSVPVALAIAGAKAFLVASFFMNLWYEKGTNLLVFVGSIVFVIIFLGITFLDFAFRGTFEPDVREPIDVIEAQVQVAEEANQSILEQFQSIPLVEEADPVLFGTEAPPPPVEAAPAETSAEAAPTEPATDASN